MNQGKSAGKSLAHDVITMATRHSSLSEIFIENTFYDLSPAKIVALDKKQVVEGAVEEFRKAIVKSFGEVIEACQEEE